MIIDSTDVLEIVMLNAKRNLVENHARLIVAIPELEAVVGGHALTPNRCSELIATIERWDGERLWFISDTRDCAVSLEDVCDAAGTKVEIVRAFFQEYLIVPFNFRRAYSALLWEANCAGTFCRVCASERCEAPKAGVHDEGRTSG